MKLHANARTCPKSRRLLVDRVLERGWSVTEAAMAAGVSDRAIYLAAAFQGAGRGERFAGNGYGLRKARTTDGHGRGGRSRSYKSFSTPRSL